MIREPTFLILSALSPGPLHGYGILKSIAELSDGRVRLRPGTLYAALDRLVTEGSLAVDSEQVVDGRLRRYYRITDGGVAVLNDSIDRLESNIAAAKLQLSRRPGIEFA